MHFPLVPLFQILVFENFKTSFLFQITSDFASFYWAWFWKVHGKYKNLGRQTSKNEVEYRLVIISGSKQILKLRLSLDNSLGTMIEGSWGSMKNKDSSNERLLYFKYDNHLVFRDFTTEFNLNYTVDNMRLNLTRFTILSW